MNFFYFLIGIVAGLVIALMMAGEIFPTGQMLADFWQWRKKWILKATQKDIEHMKLDL